MSEKKWRYCSFLVQSFSSKPLFKYSTCCMVTLLEDRWQVNESLSALSFVDQATLKCGVPLGLVLGPLLLPVCTQSLSIVIVDQATLKCGVPLGLVLGPLLLPVCTQSLSIVICRSGHFEMWSATGFGSGTSFTSCMYTVSQHCHLLIRTTLQMIPSSSVPSDFPALACSLK